MSSTQFVVERVALAKFGLYALAIGGLCSYAFDSRISVRFVLVFAIGYFLSVLIHEFGHVLGAWLLAMDVLKIRIGFGAGVTVLGHSRIVAGLGPLLSLLLGVDLLLLFGWGTALGAVGLCALVDGGYNLLPLPKADGRKLWLNHG